MSRTIIYFVSAMFVLSLTFVALGLSANRFRILEVEISPINSTSLTGLSGYTFALVSDPHLRDEPKAWGSWSNVIQRVNESMANYVLLLGDYTEEVLSDAELEVFRAKFIESLDSFTVRPILVLGNHETWNDREAWYTALKSAGANVLENESMLVEGTHPLCVIGVGDAYTGFAEKKSYGAACMDVPSLTITHDPAASFNLQGSGLWFAGHTHCGQITLPIIDPLWVPSASPKQARCGLYEDESKAVFVSSGIGNSILPIRFYAPSRVEIVKIM
jgi:predicted MPP superfamily phosphohydrolase